MSYRIASRYAKSLIDLAIEQGKLDKVVEDMTAFAAAAKIRDFALLLKSPIVKGDKKAKVIQAIFGAKIDPLTTSFIDIILRKGREADLGEIAQECISQYREIKGISIVEITSAQSLSEETLQAIRQKLIQSKHTHNTVEFVTSVDPELIGGFIVSFDDKLYDASIRHQLDLLRKQFHTKEYQTTN